MWYSSDLKCLTEAAYVAWRAVGRWLAHEEQWRVQFGDIMRRWCKQNRANWKEWVIDSVTLGTVSGLWPLPPCLFPCLSLLPLSLSLSAMRWADLLCHTLPPWLFALLQAHSYGPANLAHKSLNLWTKINLSFLNCLCHRNERLIH